MKNAKMTKTLTTLAIAIILFSTLFAGFYFDFWFQLAISITVLCALAFFFDKNPMARQLKVQAREMPFSIVLGLVSGVFLYFIFMIGNDAASILISFGRGGISGVYDFGDGVDSRIIIFLLLMIIGPGEEIIWRGYLQKSFVGKYGRLGVVVVAMAYSGVHLASGNPMLVIAALAGGIFWGFLYHYYRNLWANIISHAFWDLAVFILWPFA